MPQLPEVENNASGVAASLGHNALRSAVEHSVSDRMDEVVARLNHNKVTAEKTGMRPQASLLGDSDHIENQEIGFVPAQEGLTANFKLTSEQFDAVQDRLRRLFEDGNEVREGEIRYTSATSDDSIRLCGAYEIEYGGLRVKVARPEAEGNEGVTLRSAIGLVSIDIPKSLEESKDAASTVNAALTELLGVQDGLQEPPADAEARYKEARYGWHHKLFDAEAADVDREAMAAALSRAEVFPGYHTMIEPNKYKDYEERYGEFAVFHNVASENRIVNILDTGGLMSSHERLRRGMLATGISTLTDLETGGADSVFVRTVLQDSKGAEGEFGEYVIVAGPQVYDRTDWYAFKSDQYGATDAAHFANRQSPDEVLKSQRDDGFRVDNEQMFRTGISVQDFSAVVCKDNPEVREMIRDALQLNTADIKKLWEQGPEAVRAELAKGGPENFALFGILATDKRMGLIDRLHKSGIQTINGIPVEQFVVSGKTYNDLVDIGHRRKPRSQSS